jgi:hypothetical protein
VLRRSNVICLITLAIWSCGSNSSPAPGGGPSNPLTPSVTVVATTVTTTTATPTVFIGNLVQLEARESLSDGTTRIAVQPTWIAEAPAVATVLQSGLVSALGAGQATISAGAGTSPRGTISFRVYPNFAGGWEGDELLIGCTDSLDFKGICQDEFPLNERYFHESRFTQNQASATGTLDIGDGVVARSTGTISLDGELALPSAPFSTGDDAIVEVRNWRSRSDAPGQMTGTYQVWFAHPQLQGGFLFTLRLQDVFRNSSLTSSVSGRGRSTVAWKRATAALARRGVGSEPVR